MPKYSCLGVGGKKLAISMKKKGWWEEDEYPERQRELHNKIFDFRLFFREVAIFSDRKYFMTSWLRNALADFNDFDMCE